MNLTDPRFQDADKARQYLEAQRWPSGPICTHCGADDVTVLKGKAHRPGVYQCNACREQFTVTTGSVMERSKIPLNKWLLAMHLMASSKKGYSAHQLHRTLGITYQSAWFLAHRIREAMRESSPSPLGGSGQIVEADETYQGRTETQPTHTTSGRPFIKGKKGKRGGPAGKRPVVALVERGGRVRTFHVEKADRQTVREILVRNVRRESILHTDESKLYVETGKEYAEHQTTKHSGGEYVRYLDGRAIHSNSAENYFSVFKRGMKGIYQHCAEKHLHRYLAEYDFRYNRRSALGVEDTERAADVIRGAGGKRLMYEIPR